VRVLPHIKRLDDALGDFLVRVRMSPLKCRTRSRIPVVTFPTEPHAARSEAPAMRLNS
jgi:hypothetical protein